MYKYSNGKHSGNSIGEEKRINLSPKKRKADMINIGSIVMPLIMSLIVLAGFIKGVPIFDCFIEGAADGLRVAVKILPALVALLTSVGMLKASGAMDVICYALAPLAQLLGLPREVMPLALLRPISGSGSLAIFQDIISTHGPDSYIGRVASVMQGSTETTFYTIAIYYGVTGVKKTRHTLVSSLSADLTGFILSSVFVAMLFGRV